MAGRALPRAMDAAHRAAAGLGLAGLAYVGFLPLAAQGGIGPFTLGVALTAVGLLAAASGLASVVHARGLPALGAGFSIAAVGALLILVSDFGEAGLFLVPHAVMALALLQGAWYALLWWLGAGERGPREANALVITAWGLTAGFGLYAVLVIANGYWDALAQELVGTLGSILAARNLPGAVRTLQVEADALDDVDLQGLRSDAPAGEPRERAK